MPSEQPQKILLSPSSFGELDQTPLELLKQNGIECIQNPFCRKLTKEEVMELLASDISGLIAGLEPLDREVLGHSSLKVISRCGSGMSNVDQTAAKELGIKVFSTPFGPTNAVAELTISCILSLLRHVPQMDRDLHDGKWTKIIGGEVRGKNVAIIGYGRIGQRVGSLLTAFGAKIIPVDPWYNKDTAVPRCLKMNEALIHADIITLHCSGEEQILGPEQFANMKNGVIIVNAARGGIVKEDALLEALKDGKVGGAWLDTFAEEPYIGPLCHYPQVILTPHIGSYSLDCRRSMELEAAENLIKGLQSAT